MRTLEKLQHEVKTLAKLLSLSIDAIKWIFEEPLFSLEEVEDYQDDIWITTEELDINNDLIKNLFDIQESEAEELAEEVREQANERFKEFAKQMKAKFPEQEFWFDKYFEDEKGTEE